MFILNKKACIIANALLLTWFFLDMTGLRFSEHLLVTRSYQEDGMFFLIYLLAFLCFIFKERIGKWLLLGWLSIWLALQFLAHEWYTIFGGGFMGTLENKIEYFSDTMQWLRIEGVYIPDVYHTVLHILILVSLVCLARYIAVNRKKSYLSGQPCE